MECIYDEWISTSLNFIFIIMSRWYSHPWLNISSQKEKINSMLFVLYQIIRAGIFSSSGYTLQLHDTLFQSPAIDRWGLISGRSMQRHHIKSTVKPLLKFPSAIWIKLHQWRHLSILIISGDGNIKWLNMFLFQQIQLMNDRESNAQGRDDWVDQSLPAKTPGSNSSEVSW